VESSRGIPVVAMESWRNSPKIAGWWRFPWEIHGKFPKKMDDFYGFLWISIRPEMPSSSYGVAL